MRQPFVLALLVAGLTAGCANLQPVADKSRYYLLSGPEAAPTAPAADGLRIALQPLALPAYLQRREIAVQQGRSAIAYLDGQRWAEGLDTALQRCLAQHLQAQDHVREVVPSPFAQSGAFDRTIVVRINEFQGRDDGTVRLAASWDISPGGPHNRAAFAGAWTPGDISSLVTELSALTGRLAAALGADL